jgi:hypothetical protein
MPKTKEPETREEYAEAIAKDLITIATDGDQLSEAAEVMLEAASVIRSMLNTIKRSERMADAIADKLRDF